MKFKGGSMDGQEFTVDDTIYPIPIEFRNNITHLHDKTKATHIPNEDLTPKVEVYSLKGGGPDANGDAVYEVEEKPLTS